MKLNLGCGNDIKDGFINIDAVQHDGVDVVMDLSDNELPFDNNSIEYINCQDIIEHLFVNRHHWFLSRCYDKLIVGGKIYIQTPDLETLCKRYCGVLENPSPLQHDLDGNRMAMALFANPNIYDSHKWSYDQFTLREILESIGFTILSIGSDGGQNLLCLAQK